MTAGARNSLFLLEALWGFLLVILPAVLVFDDGFVLSPLLVAAFACAGLSGAIGASFDERRVVSCSARRAWHAVSSVEALLCRLVLRDSNARRAAPRLQ